MIGYLTQFSFSPFVENPLFGGKGLIHRVNPQFIGLGYGINPNTFGVGQGLGRVGVHRNRVFFSKTLWIWVPSRFELTWGPWQLFKVSHLEAFCQNPEKLFISRGYFPFKMASVFSERGYNTPITTARLKPHLGGKAINLGKSPVLLLKGNLSVI